MNTSVDATVRITPRSLLVSAAIGTAALAAPLFGLLAWGTGWAGGIASTTGGLLALLVLFSWVFVVGYRRHGRPVPTEARADGAALAIRVPGAWGTLFREELRLELRSVKRSGDGLTVRGPAEEWWDPGRYEVQIRPEAAGTIEAELDGLEPRAADERTDT